MAKKEEVILEIKVDQNAAETELHRAEKAILDTKKAMGDLNKSYKEGKTSQEEYIKESLRMQDTLRKEGEIKKTQIKLMQTESNSRNALRLKIKQLITEMDNLDTSTKKGIKDTERLQKEIAGLVDQLNKGSKAANLFKDNIGNYANSIKEAAKDIQFAGTSLGSLTATLKAFMTPAGLAAGAITALGAAYLNSAAGARDFQKAQNQVTAALDLLSNRVGNQGGGFLENMGKKISNAVANLSNLRREDAEAAKQRSRIAAAELNYIDELEVRQIEANEAFKKREREAEKFRNIRDDQEQSFLNRLAAAQSVEESLNGSGEARIGIIRKQIRALESYLENTDQIKDGEIISLKYQAQMAQYLAEISDIEEDITGKKSENLAATRSLTKEMREQAQLEALMADNARRTSRDRPLFTPGALQERAGGVRRVQREGVEGTTAVDVMGIDPEVFQLEKGIADARIQLSNDVTAKVKENERALAEYRKEVNKQYLVGIGEAAGQAATLFEEQTMAYKIFASAQTAISAWTASQKVFESYAGLGPAGVAIGNVQRALALAQGLAAVLEINDVGFARGGFTGAGYGSPDSSGYKRAGVVHEGEYVVPKKIVESPAGRARIQALESMRLRPYADGGLVTNNSVMDGAAAVAMANAARNTAPVEVSVVEITKKQNQVKARENKRKI